MIEPFYGKGFGHKYHQFETWAKTRFDAGDPFIDSITRAIPFVKKIVQMRNAVDHPGSEPGAPLVYANFDLEEVDGAPVLVMPRWSLTGEQLRPMLDDFDQIIEGIISLGEQLLVHLFEKFRMAPMLVIAEIPAVQRSPDRPIRLTVTVAGHVPAASD